MKHILLLVLVLAACGPALAVDFRIPQLLVHDTTVQPYNIDFQEDQVILRNQNYIWIHSIFNPWSPRLEAVFRSQYIIEDVNMLGGNQIYICSQDPANLVSTVDTLSYPGTIYFTNTVPGNKITREGSMLYVADRFKGIDIIDIGKGGMRELKSTFSEKWGIRDFIAEYPYLWALNDFGLVTVDISDLQFPISMGVNYEITDATVMAKNGDIVWLGAGKKTPGHQRRGHEQPPPHLPDPPLQRHSRPRTEGQPALPRPRTGWPQDPRCGQPPPRE